MALSTQPYKGTRDFYPADYRLRQWMFERMTCVARGFGYEPYDGPMLEPFELYAAKTGEEIVNQQLYWMMDRGERKLAVRPEMTPTLARMVAARAMELPKPIRWFSFPNLWRYERPQRGRLREHWQLNVDVLGGDVLLADAEILTFALELVRAFGGEKHVRIRVNHRQLVDHLFQKKWGLDSEKAVSAMKAVDAKDKVGEEKFLAWLGEAGLSSDQVKELHGFFGMSFEEVAKQYPCDGVESLRKLLEMVSESDPEKRIVYDPTVMRGLDYYTGTVFEMFDESPENNRAMFGGGRYDNLIGLFGKQQLSGVGFGMGDVTFQNFLEVHGLLPDLPSGLDLYVTCSAETVRSQTDQVARVARGGGLTCATALEFGKLGNQLKTAAKLGARYVAIMGEDELQKGQVMLKELATGKQSPVSILDIPKTIGGSGK